MTTQALTPPRIASPRGTTSLARLRPGDWLQSKSVPDLAWCVLINSEAKRRIVMFTAFLGYEESFSYADLFTDDTYLMGRGKPRWWHRWLPKYLRDVTCPYSLP